MKRVPAWLQWTASALVIALAAWMLWRQLQSMSGAQLVAALRATPPSLIAASILATAVSFACLAAFERLSTQWIAPGRVPRGTAWRIGLEAHALANTLGFHALTAVALRLRSYRLHGIDAVTLAKIVALIAASVATGVVAIVLVALAWSQVLAGRGLLVVLLAIALVAAFAVLRLRLRQFPTASQVLAHLGWISGLGLLEMASAVGALALLVPAEALPGGPVFVLLFVSAMVLGLVSHAPGGLGVFEATFLAAAAPARREEVLAALLLFRLVYNLLPCALALLAIGLGRWRGWRD